MEQNFKIMSDTELVSYTVKQHYKCIYYAAKKVKLQYRRIPLEWEDLFNVFLLNIPEILRNYDSSISVTVPAYISTKGYYFMANHARKYLKKDEEVLNNYIEFSSLDNNKEIMESQHYDSLNDSLPQQNYSIDIEKFTNTELLIFKELYLNNLSNSECTKKLGLTYHQVSSAKRRVKNKIKESNKKFLQK